MCRIVTAPSIFVGLATLIVALSSPAFAESEPNNSCLGAQDLGAVALSFSIEGSLDTPPVIPDVDYFRLVLEPGTLVRIDLEGESTGGGTLTDPLVATFGSACFPLWLDDGSGEGSNARLIQVVPGDGILVVAATGCSDHIAVGIGTCAGSYRLTVTRVSTVSSISGRLLDASTFEPVVGEAPVYAVAELLRDTGFGGLDVVASERTGADGRFRFNHEWDGPLRVGAYHVRARAASYETVEVGPFSPEEDEDHVLEDLLLVRPPLIGSIRGRVVDAVTGDPVTSASTEWVGVYLQRRDEHGSFDFVAWLEPTTDGRFLFPAIGDWTPLSAGEYRIEAGADRYQPHISHTFDVVGEEHIDLGSLGIEPFPVWITEVYPCDDLPPEGGVCDFGVEMTNRTRRRLRGEAWALVSSSSTGSFLDWTSFQAGRTGADVPVPERFNLKRGASRALRFRFAVPGDIDEFMSICPRVLIGGDPHPRFNTLGYDDLFCIRKEPSGLRVITGRNADERPGRRRLTKSPD